MLDNNAIHYKFIYDVQTKETKLDSTWSITTQEADRMRVAASNLMISLL